MAPLQGVCGADSSSYVQIPPLYGTEKDVRGSNFVPVNLADFEARPADLAPPDWDGRVLLLFILKDGAPGTKVQAFVTEQPGG